MGRVNEANEDFGLYESDTIMADEHAFMLKVRNTVKSVSEQVHFVGDIDVDSDAVVDALKAAWHQLDIRQIAAGMKDDLPLHVE